MHVDRISIALTRIETAALRITEAVRDQAAPQPAVEDERFQELRREATTALAELDKLIGQLEA